MYLSFQINQKAAWALPFLEMFLTKYGVTLPLFLLQVLLSDGDNEHQWKRRFLMVLYLTCETLLKLNNLPADKGKSSICIVFAEAEMIFSVCMQNSV